jgi:Fe-S cluster biogenesis protein NfuA
MTNNKDFHAKIQRIGGLIAELDNISDPEVRAGAKALVQLLLDLHAAGLKQVMEIIAKDVDAGQLVIDSLGRDPLVSSLLVLYGLHPLDLESRVVLAVEKITPQVRRGGGKLELLGVENGGVRVRIHVEGHACASTGKTLQTMVEDALYEAAPDMNALVVEGLEERAGSNGFVPLGKLGGLIAVASGVNR